MGFLWLDVINFIKLGTNLLQNKPFCYLFLKAARSEEPEEISKKVELLSHKVDRLEIYFQNINEFEGMNKQVQRLESLEQKVTHLERQLSDKEKYYKNVEETIQSNALRESKNELVLDIRARFSVLEARLKQQEEENKILKYEIKRHLKRTMQHKWRIPVLDLESEKLLLNKPFYTTTNSYCFQMGAQYNSQTNEVHLSLYRCRGIFDDPTNHLKTFIGFKYTLYASKNNGEIVSRFNYSTNSTSFDVMSGEHLSVGVVSMGFIRIIDRKKWMLDDHLHLGCEIAPLQCWYIINKILLLKVTYISIYQQLSQDLLCFNPICPGAFLSVITPSSPTPTLRKSW